MTWKIADDGDDVEKHAWSVFLETELPSYETFWAREIVPLTNRPDNIYLKTDDEIAKLPHPPSNIPEAVCITQLHHSVMRHLLFVFEIRQRGMSGFDDFTNGIIRVVSAQDVAFELLGRRMRPGAFDVYDPHQCRKARREWTTAVKNNPALVQFDCRALDQIQNYRHRLVHGRIPSWWKLGGSAPRVPSLEAVDKYLDWRRANDPKTTLGNPDFESASEVLDEARAETVAYLEKAWKDYLLR